MATEIKKLSGKAFYPKLFEQNKDTKFNPEGTYVLTLLVDDDTAEDWDKYKTKNKSKYDRVTKTNQITFRRQHNAKFEWAGGAPKVYNKDGSERKFDDGIIWNDSVLEATVAVFDTGVGKVSRLEAVTVLELAEAPDRDGDEPKAPDKPAPTKKQQDNDDGEIPF